MALSKGQNSSTNLETFIGECEACMELCNLDIWFHFQNILNFMYEKKKAPQLTQLLFLCLPGFLFVVYHILS